MSTHDELQRIAAMGHALRPDWPVRSLLTVLERDHAERAYGDLAVALAWVATDPATKTPARLAEPGPWWTPTRGDDRVPIVGPGREARCPEHEHELARACRPCRADRLGGIPNPYAPAEPIRGDEPRRPMPRIPAKEA